MSKNNKGNQIILDYRKGVEIHSSGNLVDWPNCDFCGRPSKKTNHTVDGKLICSKCYHKDQRRAQLEGRR